MPTIKQAVASDPNDEHENVTEVPIHSPQHFIDIWVGANTKQFDPATTQETSQSDAVSPSQRRNSHHGEKVHLAHLRISEERIISQMTMLMQEHERAMHRKLHEQTHDLQARLDADKKSSLLWFHDHFKRLGESVDVSLQKLRKQIGTNGSGAKGNSAIFLSRDPKTSSNPADISSTQTHAEMTGNGMRVSRDLDADMSSTQTRGLMTGDMTLGLDDEKLSPSQGDGIRLREAEVSRNIAVETLQRSQNSQEIVNFERERLEAHVDWMISKRKKVRFKESVLRCFGLRASSQRDAIIPTSCIEELVDSSFFSVMSSCIILTNAIWIGYQTDDEMSRARMHLDPVEWARFVDLVFLSLFSIEVLCRLVAYKSRFLVRRDAGWNVFDSIVVVCTLIDHIIEALDSRTAPLQVLQMLRLLRVVQLIRILRHLIGMRIFILVLIDSFVAILFASLLMASTAYFISVSIMRGALAFGSHSEIVQLKAHFGSVTGGMYTLYQSLSGGILWGEVVKDINAISWFFEVLFVFYIIFCTLGIFNVLIGLFGETTKFFKKADGYVAIEHETTMSNAFLSELTGLMKDHGYHKSGLDEDEFTDFIKNADVRMYLQSHGIYYTEAIQLFRLLEQGGQNSVTVEQFVYGVQRLRGHANGLDILSLSDQANLTQDKLRDLKDKYEASFRVVHGLLDTMACNMQYLRGDILETSQHEVILEMERLREDILDTRHITSC